MRISAGWNDACILNISERGLMVRATSTSPRCGSYVEIRRGARIIIGRVMWARQGRFGLATQDSLDVQSIIAAPDGDGTEAAALVTTALYDRRTTARLDTAFDRSRQLSSSFEFGCVTVFAVAGSMIAYSAVAQLFTAPMAAIEQAFVPG